MCICISFIQSISLPQAKAVRHDASEVESRDSDAEVKSILAITEVRYYN